MWSRPRFVGAVFILCCTLLISGCATQQNYTTLLRDPGLPYRVELVDTPFFSDDSHFCGPAALATSLSAAGVPIRPVALIQEVFLPNRKGSLQIEMLASARRHGAVATMIPGTLDALLREVAAGHPVVVLQNLGLSWAPSWHYAVVIGYDLNEGVVLLRSGPMKRQELGLRTFEHTWARSQNWAFVTLPPGQLPVTAAEDEVTHALMAFERNAPPHVAATAYRSGLAKWPNNPILAMGLGNVLYAKGDYRSAEKIFRQTARTHHLAAAYNNHAQTLLKLKRYKDARQAVKQGLAVADAGAMRATLLETLDAIDAVAAR